MFRLVIFIHIVFCLFLVIRVFCNVGMFFIWFLLFMLGSVKFIFLLVFVGLSFGEEEDFDDLPNRSQMSFSQLSAIGKGLVPTTSGAGSHVSGGVPGLNTISGGVGRNVIGGDGGSNVLGGGVEMISG
jgi:hypothetical protein